MINLPGDLIAYAILGSLIPTIIWFLFWTQRDRFCPEPKVHLFGAFMFGALAALFTLPAQGLVASVIGSTGTVALVLFVCVEEVAKFVCCWYIAMRNNPYFNERIDPIIYLMTTALGFTMLENILYFLQYLDRFNLDVAVLEGGKRIVGAGILHMVTCGIIGICIAFVFHKGRTTRAWFAVLGIVLAICVHIGFNYMVINTNPDYTLIAFASTWFLFIITLISLELLRSPTCPPDIDWLNHDGY